MYVLPEPEVPEFLSTFAMIVGRGVGISVSSVLNGSVLKSRNNGPVFCIELFCIERALNIID